MMKKKKSLLFAVFMLFGASMTFGQINVSGRVVDDATNQTLPFVTVRVKGTSTGTVTTELGTFTLTIPSAESILEFMYVGFETLEVRAVADREIAVRLKPSAAELEAVVITGYQTIARERSTGAFSIVGQEKLENRLQGSAKSVLEGLTPGLVLTKDGNIEIRGVSTFLGDRRPLIIVDGFPLNVDYANLSTQGQSNVFNALSTGVNPLDFINPDNIESITTLKDAVAASIYGAQSANGVIIITTKSGNAAQKRGINNISYRGAFGVTLKPDLRQLQMASVDDYMDYEKDLFDRNPTAQFTNFNNYNKLSDHMYLLLAKDRRWDSAWDVSADAKIAQLRGNNALKEIEDHLMSSKVSQRHNFSLTSTTETNSIGVALGWYEERGHFRKITDENMRRLNVDLNNTWKPNKWLSVRLFSNFNYTTSHQPMVSHGFTSTTPANTVFNTLTASTPMLNSYNTLWRELTAFEFTSRILPYTRLYDDAGNPIWYYAGEQIKLDAYENTPGMKSWLYHPEDELKKTYIENDNMMIRIGGDVNTRFTDFLSATFGGTWSRGSVVGRGIYEGESFIMRTAFNDGTSDANPTNRHIPDGGKLDEVRATFGNWLIRAQLNYNQSFNNEMHRFTALAGAEVTQNTFENIFMPTR
jgi:TonB-dependent SusC/RagA subfamily outer membrane receptor